MNTQLDAILPKGLKREERLKVYSIAARLADNLTPTQSEGVLLEDIIARSSLQLKTEINGRKTFYDTKTGKPITGEVERVLFLFYQMRNQPTLASTVRRNRLFSTYEHETFHDLTTMGVDQDIAALLTKHAVNCYFNGLPVNDFGLLYYNTLVDSRWFFKTQEDRAYFYNGDLERVGDVINYGLETLVTSVVGQ